MMDYSRNKQDYGIHHLSGPITLCMKCLHFKVSDATSMKSIDLLLSSFFPMYTDIYSTNTQRWNSMKDSGSFISINSSGHTYETSYSKSPNASSSLCILCSSFCSFRTRFRRSISLDKTLGFVAFL